VRFKQVEQNIPAQADADEVDSEPEQQPAKELNQKDDSPEIYPTKDNPSPIDDEKQDTKDKGKGQLSLF
jgi:hypothetical protein